MNKWLGFIKDNVEALWAAKRRPLKSVRKKMVSKGVFKRLKQAPRPCRFAVLPHFGPRPILPGTSFSEYGTLRQHKRSSIFAFSLSQFLPFTMMARGGRTWANFSKILARRTIERSTHQAAVSLKVARKSLRRGSRATCGSEGSLRFICHQSSHFQETMISLPCRKSYQDFEGLVSGFEGYSSFSKMTL